MQGELQPHDRNSLPDADNVNPYAYSLAVNGEVIMQRGKMIAYYGQLKFEAMTATGLGAFIQSRFNSPLYAGNFTVVQGQGKLILGDRGFDINSYDIDDGNLTVRAANLLGYAGNLQLKQSIIPGYVTLLGSGTMIAASHGPVHFVEPPVRVDPQALVGWADCPSPCHHYDYSYMTNLMGAIGTAALGRSSGEEQQLDFTGAGTVLMQSSEAVVNDGMLVAQIDSQTMSLGLGGMQTLHQRLGQRIAQQQQSSF